MKKLLIVSLLSLAGAACGSKPAPVTPANKTSANKTDGSMGGASYGGASYGGAVKPPIAQPGNPCAM